MVPFFFVLYVLFLPFIYLFILFLKSHSERNSVTSWESLANVTFLPRQKALNSYICLSNILYQRYTIPQEILLTEVEKETSKNQICCLLTPYFIFNFLLSHSKKAIIFACTDTMLFLKGMVSYFCPTLLIYCLSVKLRWLCQHSETQKGYLLERTEMLFKRKPLVAFML